MEKLKNQVSAQAFALDNAIYTIDELQEKLMSPEEEAEKSLWDSKPIEELRDMHAKKKAEFESHEKEFEKAKSELEDIRDQIYTLKTSQGAVLKKSSSLPKDRLPILSTYETSDSPFFNTLREQRKKLETALGIVNQRLNQVDERTRLKSEFLRYENSLVYKKVAMEQVKDGMAKAQVELELLNAVFNPKKFSMN